MSTIDVGLRLGDVIDPFHSVTTLNSFLGPVDDCGSAKYPLQRSKKARKLFAWGEEESSGGGRARAETQGVPTGRLRPGFLFAPLRERFRGRGP
jgi:hypothetical protein